MKRTTSTLLAGALTAGTAAVLTAAAPGIASASGCGVNTVNQAQLGDWFVPALSDTRATGHYEITKDAPGGLHVYTEGATSTDKVAEYVNAGGVLLASQTAQSNYDIGYVSNHGTVGLPGQPLPGYQLVIDFDGNGSADGILVGEDVYGDDWWLNNAAAQFVKDGAPSHAVGSGSANHGNLNDWSANFPGAKILDFGFSLGSGVHNDLVIDTLTFGCNVLDFEYQNHAPTAAIFTDDASDQNYRTFYFNGAQSTDPDGDDLTYSWTFGDGTTGEGVEVQHTFPVGTHDYTATLTVSDGTASDDAAVTVHVVQPGATNTIGGDHLPNTGADVMGLAGLGGIVVLAAGAGLVANRRRKATADA